MREKLAIFVCALTVAVALGLSAVFAARHNPPQEVAKAPSAHPGEKIFEEKGCAGCHSFAGKGNPRLPLEGVAARLNDKELRDWITGDGAATNKISTTILKRKQRYRAMSEEEMGVLIDYLRMGAE